MARTRSQKRDVLVRGAGARRSAAPWRMPQAHAAPGDRGGQVVEGQDGVGEAGLGDGARHAVDGAGGLGLDEHAAARRALDRAGAVEAVLAHAGEHDEQEAAAEQARGVGDGEVGARAQAALGRVVGEAQAAVVVQAQVRAAGRDQQRCAGRARRRRRASRTVSARRGRAARRARR